jgi:Pre-mRNA 3'-end-processing endonuclease polyadenylation factor C-term
VEWQASPAGDMIADSVIALIMHAQSSVASIRLSSKPCRHPNDNTTGLDDASELQQVTKKIKNETNNETTTTTIQEVVQSRLRFVHALLKDQFQHVEAVYDSNIASFEIITDSGLETTLDDDNEDDDNNGKKSLKCLITVEVDKFVGDRAQIKIECRDEKFAANLQKTIKNALATFDKI